MSWYKKYKVVKTDNTKEFKYFADQTDKIDDSSDIQIESPTDVTNEISPSSNQKDPNLIARALEFREQILQDCLNFISTLKQNINSSDFSIEELEQENSEFTKQVVKYVKNANRQIENYNLQNPGYRIQIINWNDLGLQAPTTGVMRGLLLPFVGMGKKTDVQTDSNLPALINYIKNVLVSNNITDDEAGARILADFAASNDHPDVRMLVNEYYAKTGRNNFHDLLKLAGFSNLAEEFSKIPDQNLNYREFVKQKQGSKVIEDEVFGKEYGLDTRSEAERQILSIFRAVDLQPIPAEIKMPSTKVKKGSKDLNTEFMCDFLLPCEVLRGWNKDGSPNIESQVVFVGEYFGWYGSDYESKTSMKEELEPFQAVLSGNDVIFISKNDFEAGSNALKLINQLEAKSIIFKGGKTKKLIDDWLSQNQDKSGSTLFQSIESRIHKLSPEQAITRAAMLQLQFKFGEIAQFYQKYASPENQDYQNLVSSLYEEYKILKAKSDELNKQIRALQHKSRINASNYDWQDTISKSKDSEKINSLMEELRNVNYDIRKVYVENEKVMQIKKSHIDSLMSNQDYLSRLNELQKLYNLLEQGKDPLPEVNAPLARKVAEICNNSLAGLNVSLTRQTKQQAKEFKPMLISALNKYENVFRIIVSDLILLET